MGRRLFVDASVWIPVFVAKLEPHPACARAYREALEGGGRLVSTDLVLAEVHAFVVRRLGAPRALALVEGVLRDPQHEIVPVTAELRRRAIDGWLRKYRDQPFSLADAVSFEVMREHRITEALSLDGHFRTAGYGMVPAA
ncbi:MAG: PIN domain-containing protein [Gemmatimonadetes bacterium]|nr:PIN domain-containing protein [Gemmatimonadota bacterium]